MIRLIGLVFLGCIISACGNLDATNIEQSKSNHLTLDQNNLKNVNKPNIIVILADDMGYGDIQAYNQKSLVPTPNLNELAQNGIRFTDAHSPSAVCTPSRYSLLTGRYAWRSSLKKGVLWGHAPLLIEDERETIASMLKKNGYNTAAIGKWHLGLGNYYGEVSYYGDEISSGPNTVGFDYFFGIPGSLDMAPYLYIENNKPLVPVDGKLISASEQRRYQGGGFWRKGQVADGFVHEEVLPTLLDKAVDYIEENAKHENPFFLYFPLTAPHTPWLPSEEFIGVSGAGHYGDFAAQVDASVGKIMQTLLDNGIDENTLVIFTSDNGAHWLNSDIEQYAHLANGPLRGQKADIYEGGHRVPFIARWPSVVPSGVSSNQVTTLTDLMATFADLLEIPLSEQSAEDSYSILPSILGQPNSQSPHETVVHHSLDGMFAIRSGNWKLVEGLGSGGFTQPARINPTDPKSKYQLYNLQQDPAESIDVAAEYPAIVKKLESQLNMIRQSGRSR